MVGTEWTIEAIDPFTDKRIVLLGYASTDAVKITLAGQTLK